MPDFNERGNNKYMNFKYKNKNYHTSFYPFYWKPWNILPDKTRKLNIDDFKIETKTDFSLYHPKGVGIVGIVGTVWIVGIEFCRPVLFDI